MNWNNLLEWSEDEWKQLGRKRVHHPKCQHPEEAIEAGRTPRLTHGNTRISWMDAQSHFGHQCATGLRTSKVKSSGDKAAMEDVLERVSRAPDDEEAKRELAALSMKQLASIATGRGAQQLRALELISDMARVGLTAPEVGKAEKCPVGHGELDCPICGGRHQPADVYVSDGLMQSLQELDEIQMKDEEMKAAQQAADKYHRFTQ